IKRLKLQNQASLYKKLTIAFGIALVAALIVIIYLYRAGLISDNPGWM
ncbi:MAG: hypothetical protein IT242_09960, partial [Bacteroidia bacterium]|nr:hypothetical protein [Bacteroidia bacterium]